MGLPTRKEKVKKGGRKGGRKEEGREEGNKEKKKRGKGRKRVWFVQAEMLAVHSLISLIIKIT